MGWGINENLRGSAFYFSIPISPSIAALHVMKREVDQMDLVSFFLFFFVFCFFLIIIIIISLAYFVRAGH